MNKQSLRNPKDNRSRKWCHDAAYLTSQSWCYVKIPWKVFQDATATTFDGLYRHALAATDQNCIALRPGMDYSGGPRLQGGVYDNKLDFNHLLGAFSIWWQSGRKNVRLWPR